VKSSNFEGGPKNEGRSYYI